MRPNDAIVPGANIYTPSYVVPLGKAIYHAPKDSDCAKTVDGFRAVLVSYKIGTPERTYCDAMMANAVMISKGIASKTGRRDDMLEEIEQRKVETEKSVSQWDRFWEKLAASAELFGVGGLVWAISKYMISVPAIEQLLEGAGREYVAMATALGSVLFWSAVRTRIDQRRALKSSRYCRRMKNRIWKMYRVGLKREYYQALYSVTIAWEQMAGERPQDAEVARMMLEALMREADEYDEMNGDYDLSLCGEIRTLLLSLLRRRKAKEAVISAT